MNELDRFLQAQTWDYPIALEEIRRGRKVSHWMWYIFPQLRGLGRSNMAQYYGIADLAEAKSYAADPVLGARLREISQAMLDQPHNDAREVLGGIDARKLCSSMTLFEIADPEHDVYGKVLERFYKGRRDHRTLEMLK